VSDSDGQVVERRLAYGSVIDRYVACGHNNYARFLRGSLGVVFLNEPGIAPDQDNLEASFLKPRRGRTGMNSIQSIRMLIPHYLFLDSLSDLVNERLDDHENCRSDGLVDAPRTSFVF
jgi:hypothetical protein